MPLPSIAAFTADVLRRNSKTAQLVLAGAALGIVSAIGWAAPRLQTQLDTPVAAVFPPWWSAEQAFVAAAQSGVQIAGEGLAPHIVIVSIDRASAIGDLYRQGAWGLIRVDAVAECAPDGNNRNNQADRAS
jgi:hypothetical protein